MIELPNPLIAGYNPDPSIVRVGGDYYLATSTFEYRPGIPIYHSTDLINWTLINHVITRPGQLQDKGVPTLGGAWAPTIRFHDGLFYVAVTDAMGRGTLVFTATHPAEEWSDGLVIDVDGIDPDLAWDEAGTCYMTFSGLILNGPEVGAHKGIQQARIDLNTGQRLEPVRDIWSGTGLMFPEAPHLYQIGDWWYLMIAEGGTERGHSVSIARGLTPYGPFESCPANPVLSARSTSRPIQNTGHGDLVHTLSGDWVMVLLGMRTRGMTRAFSSLGRETFATNVTWKNGWPVVEPVIANELSPAPEYQVNFAGNYGVFANNTELFSVRDFPSDFGLVNDQGLKMLGVGKDLDQEDPTLIARRQRRFDSLSQVVFAIEGDAALVRAGLTVRYDEHNHYDIEYSKGKLIARSAISCLNHEVVVDQADVDLANVSLYLEMTAPGDGFVASTTSDLVHLGYFDRSGKKQELAVFDGRYLSAEVTTSFTGRVIGFYVVDGEVTVKAFSELPSSK